MDFDHAGQTNFFKYVAGLNPIVPMSVFTLVIAPVPSQPGRRAVIFNPIVSGRSYTVKFKPDLAAGTWATLTGTTQSDNFATRTVTDLNVSDPERFSQIEITKP